MMLFAVVVGLALTQVAAQDGAIVLRGEDEGLIYWEWNGDNVLAVYSTHSEFYCADGYEVPYQWQSVERPNEVLMLWFRGHLFTRAWYATPSDVFATGDPWDFICNGQQVAEGIAHLSQMDNDANISGRGANVYGWTVAGTLYDLVSICGDDGMVDLNSIRKWKIMPHSDYPACAPDCVIPQVIRGPELNCGD